MRYLMDQNMPILVVTLFLLCFCDAEYKVKCSNSSESTTSMRASVDGVKGRYTVEWCTDISEKDRIWKLEVSYNRANLNICRIKNTHSSTDERINYHATNCSFVCLSTDLDLIFSACYVVQNWFPSRGSLKHITSHNISNGLTVETFTDSESSGNTVNHGDYVSAHIHLGMIPATKYTIELCRYINATATEKWSCADAWRNCSATSAGRSVACVFRAPAARYDLRLEQRAPWTGAAFALNKRRAHLPFEVKNVTEARVAVEPAGRGALAAGAAALAALLAAAAALALALRARRGAKLRKQVLREWLHRQESSGGMAAESSVSGGPVLVAYAREGPPAARLVRALVRLLRAVVPGQVYDLHSSETVALSAADPAGWLRDFAETTGSKVLLLQTPAVLTQVSLRVVYREPSPGDALLPLALRLVDADQRPYRRYYLAAVEGVEAEAVPHAVPYRRYLLPTHAAALALQLAGRERDTLPPQAVSLVDELSRCIVDFVDHVRAHPDYLAEQLLVL